MPGGLLTDAEAGEDSAKQVVGTECAGNLAKRLLCLTQVFGQQLSSARQGELSPAVFQRVTGMAQRLKMASTRAEAAFEVCS